MLITFKTETHANITMFGDVAKTLIRMMGHNHEVPGAILAEDIPDALTRLRQALTGNAATSPAPADEEEDAQHISLDKRALPLIELLESAQANKDDVIWEPGY